MFSYAESEWDGEKIFHVNSSQKSTGMPAQTSEKLDLNSKIITGDKNHYIIVKGSGHTEGFKILIYRRLSEKCPAIVNITRMVCTTLM